MISSYILILTVTVYIVHGNINTGKPYIPTNGKCKNGEYKRGNQCCNSCPAGTYASKLCDGTTNTICKECGSGAFTAIPNHVPACLSCNGVCGNNQVEVQQCNKTQNRICDCSTESYCLFKGSGPGCKICTPKTKCGIGYGVTGHTDQGDTICSRCDVNTYSNIISSVDKCKPTPKNTFNHIDVEINLYPVNDSSCVYTTTTGVSESISTSELTINMYHTDCDPVFYTEYFSVLNNVATSGFFTRDDIYQDPSKTCKLNIEIKCNKDDTDGTDSIELTKEVNRLTTPHSETVTVIGRCLSSINVYILYSDTNTLDYDTDTVSFRIGNTLDIDSHMPASCGVRKILYPNTRAF
ncbi:tnf receptor [Skunkpox virus]|uniref:Tnf receptor n=1 Tax=Skunkpox virus TaxID=160796 RepID=A0A1C9KC15_9POXV|nr:tnf receptor [Skunkpox virus]YP_009282904.1 tnf receptor [Skunkpox virus]AOP31481.1 tnf receptor [Skunkpox virus]AOP31689.1 tnf receptor [Skunkpox virus]